MKLHENFVYSTLENVLVIIDTNIPGKKSVTNDIENVLVKIMNDGMARRKGLEKVLYQDTDGIWTHVIVDPIKGIYFDQSFLTKSLGEALKIVAGIEYFEE